LYAKLRKGENECMFSARRKHSHSSLGKGGDLLGHLFLFLLLYHVIAHMTDSAAGSQNVAYPPGRSVDSRLGGSAGQPARKSQRQRRVGKGGGQEKAREGSGGRAEAQLD